MAQPAPAIPGQGSPPQPNGWLLLSGLIALVALSAGLVLAALIGFHQELLAPGFIQLDQAAFAVVRTWAAPPLTLVMRALTAMGYTAVAVPIVTIVFAWLVRRRLWHDGTAYVLSVAGDDGLDQGLKQLFHRPRPAVPWALAHETSFSFPSSHAMVSIVLYGMLAYLVCRWWITSPSPLLKAAITTFSLLLIAGIGFSRVYLGVHFATDVLAGYIAGGIWLACAIVATEALHRSNIFM